MLVFLIAKSSLIKDAKAAAEFQNFILCLEMMVAAIGHLYAFPYKEYQGANITTSSDLPESLAHFYDDTVHQVCHQIYCIYEL